MFNSAEGSTIFDGLAEACNDAYRNVDKIFMTKVKDETKLTCKLRYSICTVIGKEGHWFETKIYLNRDLTLVNGVNVLKLPIKSSKSIELLSGEVKTVFADNPLLSGYDMRIKEDSTWFIMVTVPPAPTVKIKISCKKPIITIRSKSLYCFEEDVGRLTNSK